MKIIISHDQDSTDPSATYSAEQFEQVLELPFSERLLAAMKCLKKSYSPHGCGGFTTDDMQWRMGIGFTPDGLLFDSLDELTDAGLIRIAGYDEEDAIGTCYELTV